jgi:hypothetical protein
MKKKVAAYQTVKEGDSVWLGLYCNPYFVRLLQMVSGGTTVVVNQSRFGRQVSDLVLARQVKIPHLSP